MLNWKAAVRLFSLLLLLASFGLAQTHPSAAASTAVPSAQAGAQKGMMMLTIFFKHDQSKTLDQINAELKAHNYYNAFPPPGIEVVSWYVIMGIGQVVTLRFPAERLREVNVAVEKTAWGGYRTEFYPTYDYKTIWENEIKKQQQR